MFSLIITLANSIYLNNTSEKRTKKCKTTKRSIISLNSSTELTKLKRLIRDVRCEMFPGMWDVDLKNATYLRLLE